MKCYAKILKSQNILVQLFSLKIFIYVIQTLQPLIPESGNAWCSPNIKWGIFFLLLRPWTFRAKISKEQPSHRCSSQPLYHTLKTLSREDTTWQVKETYWEGKGLVLDEDKPSGYHGPTVGGIHCSLLDGSLSPSRAALFLNWKVTAPLSPHLSHTAVRCCPLPELSSSHPVALITWAHPKLFKFTATWCNPAFMFPLNPFRQLMLESRCTFFTQSHSNEQNLNRGRSN